jgi:transcriptional regulator with XRE-family HTH domain
VANSLRNEIATLITNRRREIGLTQADLARAIGVSRPSITNIENGRQSLSVEQLYEIALVLNTQVLALLPELPKPTTEVEEYMARLRQIAESHGRPDQQ